jgi:hypothetical protein
MDKNTILGFVLIALIVIGFYQINKPNEAEQAKIRNYNDSIALVEQNKAAAIQKTLWQPMTLLQKYRLMLLVNLVYRQKAKKNFIHLKMT